MKEMKRILSLFLCLVMLVGYLPVGALAAEGESATEPTVVETTEATEAAVETTEAATEETTEPVVETTEAIVETTEATVPETTEETVPETKPVPPPMFTFMGGASKEAAGDTQVTAEEVVVDAAIFFSDLHAGRSSNYSYTLTYKEDIVKGVMTAAKNTGLKFSSVTSVGDLFAVNGNEQTGANDKTYLSPEEADKDIIGSYIQSVLGDVTINYTWSDHDRSSDIPNVTGLIYGDNGTDSIADDENYYIYAISMSDMSTGTRYGVTPTFEESKLTDFTDTMARLDPSKPVFIASHQPLHAKRSDNQNAYKWFEVINAAAAEHDIIFFWGHNHNKDESRFYYYGVGDDMTVQNGSSTKSVQDIKFSHICTGYLDPTTKNSDGQTRTGTILVTKILDNSIQVTTYNSSGVYSGTNALDVTIERLHEDDELPGGNEGGNTEPPATEPPVVTDPEPVEDTNGTGITVTASGVESVAAVKVEGEHAMTSVVATAVEGKLHNYKAYDITVTGFAEGDTAVVALPLHDASIADPKVYHVSAAGELEPMPVTKVENGFVYFETTHFSTYVLGDGTEVTTGSGNATVPGTEVTNSEDVWVRVSAPTAGKEYLIVGTRNNTSYVMGGNTVTPTTGELTIDGKESNYTYLPANTTGTVWTVSGDSNGWSFANSDGGYLGYTYTTTSGGTITKYTDYTYTLSTNDTTERVWNYASNTLYRNLITRDYSSSYRTDTYSNYYVTCGYSNNWSMETTSGTLYLYEKAAATTTTGTPDKTYSVVGNDVNTNGNGTEKTVTLSSTLYEQTGDGEPVDVTDSFDGTVTYELVASKSDPDIVKDISGNTAILTGKLGTAIVKVTYTNEKLTAWDEFAIVVTERQPNSYVGIPGASKTVFRLADSLENGKKYVIVNSNTAGAANALNLSGSSIASTGVTVITDANGTYINAPATSAQWTYTSADKFQNVGTTSSYLRGREGTGTLRTGNSNSLYTTWYYDDDYGVYRQGILYYNIASDFQNKTASTSDRVYIYGEDTITTAGGYAILEGENEFTFPLNGYEESVVRSGIQVYTATDVNGTGRTLTTEYELSGNIDAGTPGEYPVTVLYEGVALGTVTVIINTEPSLQITENGAVVTAAIVRRDAHVGDRVQLGVIAYNGHANVENPTITWSIDGEYAGMAAVENGVVTLKNNSGTFYVDASWDCDGKTLTDRVQITVSPFHYVTPEEGTNDYPEYPAPGGLRYDKTAEAVGNFSQTGVAQMELSMTGIPYGGGADVVVVIDTSSSMRRDASGNAVGYDNVNSRFYIMKQSLESMLKQFDGNDVDIAIVDFNGYSDSSSADNGNNYITGSNLVGDNNGYRNEANKGKVYTGDGNGNFIMGSSIGGVAGLDEDHFESALDSAFNETRIAKIMAYFTEGSTGTNYDFGFECAYELLKDKKAANEAAGETREQFVIFLTDGSPFRYNGFTNENADGRNEMDKVLSGDYASVAELKQAFSWMTDAVAEMYDPAGSSADPNPDRADGGVHRHRMAEAIKGTPGQTYYAVDSTNDTYNGTTSYLKPYNGLGAKIYSIGFCIADDKATGNNSDIVEEETSWEVVRVLSSGAGYYWEDLESADALTTAFKGIAKQISEAATNIVVTDKIAEDYTMIFGIPQSIGTDDKAAQRNTAVKTALANQEFFIEVVKYPLDSGKRTGTKESLIKVYLKDSNGDAAGGTYSAAKDKNGTAFEDVTFTAAGVGKTAYWAVVEDGYVAGANEVLVTVSGTTYRFVETGNGTHNVTAGAYAFGNIDAKTNMSNDLVIVTPYFAYSADNKMLVWTCDKVQKEYDIALRYLLYLDNSATEIGTGKETEVGAHLTNDWAYITYTNHLDNPCRQEFPKPQMTWNGAQVSYVFYLVNTDGQPINKSGKVVDFAQATFVTDVYTESVVWNDTDTQETTEGVAYLDAQYKAIEKLPEGYKLYDNDAYYELKVYEDHAGNVLDNYFIIEGTTTGDISKTTTKVYNTKAGTRYTDYGAYAAEAGKTYISAKTEKSYTANAVADGFDFANTTVAFAVVWEKKLVPDTVVVDFGLDVLINVTQNDMMQNVLTGIDKNEPGFVLNTAVNDGEQRYKNAELTLDSGHYAKIENDNQIRFTQKNMEFQEAETFYYESYASEFVEGNATKAGYMYSTVTVIPATTIYYEDSFVDLNTYKVGYEVKEYTADDFDKAVQTTAIYTKDGDTYTRARTFEENTTYYVRKDQKADGWASAGNTVTVTQAQDRPGVDKISAALDADNNYGYDAAYLNSSRYSLGSSAKITVDANTYGTAQFDFYGTGFDVISVTSGDTGVLVVQVFDGEDNLKVSKTVDTYYGMQKNGDEWETTDRGTLYQVPVIKIEGLTHGKYTAKITASYYDGMNNMKDGSYDLYLDAIRIYNPTGDKDQTSMEAYQKDGEAYPQYFELRNSIIDTETYNSLENNADQANGIVFIDGIGNGPSIAEYTSYGPNNEVYLATGQAIAFDLNATHDTGKDAKVQMAIKSVGGTGGVEVYGVNSDGTTVDCLKETINTATDMYYDITALNGKTVVIKSTGAAIISITNIKCTGHAYPVSMELIQAEDGTVTGAKVSYADGTTTGKTGDDLTVTENEDGSKIYTYTETINNVTYNVTVVQSGNTNQKSTVKTVNNMLTFSHNSMNAALATMAVAEEPEVPENSEPEVIEPEHTETTAPEDETTEPEETEPEETKPENTKDKLEQALAKAAEQAAKIAQNMKKAAEQAAKALSKVLSRWF